MPRKPAGSPEQSLHYWRCYAKDIESSARFRMLSWAAQGMAWRLFNLQFLAGDIPENPAHIARMLGAGQEEFMREWPDLEQFFPVVAPGIRRNPKQEGERDHCLGIINVRRAAGAGKSKESEPDDPESTAIGTPKGTANGVPFGDPNAGQKVQQVTTRTKNQEPRTSNQEEREGDKPAPRKKEAVSFIPPTQEEVRLYMVERGWKDVDFWAEKWIDHYQPDWKISGGKKMTDWQRAVRTWEQPNRMKKTSVSETVGWDL